MRLDVIAFPRRQGVFLAVVLEQKAGPAGGLLSVVAERGARFDLPSDRVLARAAVTADEVEPAAALASLRAALEAMPAPDWPALHAGSEPGRSYALAELVPATDAGGGSGALRVALATPDAEPWFRRDGVRLVARSPDEVRSEEERGRRERWIASEGEAFLAWWPEREDRGVPPGWRLGSLDALAAVAPPETGPDASPAGAGALRALASYAALGDRLRLGGTDAVDATVAKDAGEWGADLARRAGLPADPDQVLEALVTLGVLRDDVDPAPWRAGVAAALGPEALAEAAEIARAAVQPGDREQRRDLAGLVAVAVDDAGTREVDDAISLRRIDGGWELGVHVADLAAALDAGGALDAEITARACSLYTPDGSVLLLPADLVTGRLSLSADEPRHALSGFFTLDDEARVLASRFERTRLRLARRLTYAETTDTAGLAGDAETGAALVRLAGSLRSLRRARGARVLTLPGLRVELRGGRPELGLRGQDTPGDLVVSECMVLHNERAAAALVAAGAPALFRVQAASEEPVPDAADPLFALKIRRTFGATHMSARPKPHVGLAADAYTQCTSPLRRFSDLVNQRQLAAVSSGEAAPYDEEPLAALAPVLAERERCVRRAGDARFAYWVARALAERDPPVLEGILVRAPRRGAGQVWVTELQRQFPLRAPRDWRAPPVGSTARWRIARVRPWRGRVELGPLSEEEGR